MTRVYVLPFLGCIKIPKFIEIQYISTSNTLNVGE